MTLREKFERPVEQSSIETAMAMITLLKGAQAELWAFKNIPGAYEDDNALVIRKDTENYPLVRVHSSCVSGDIYHARQCDCGDQLKEAIERISEEGGAIIYLHQEGRGIGLFNKMRAYQEKAKGFDTYTANRNLGLPDDARDFRVAGDILKHLGMKDIRLLTNNPNKIKQLTSYGICIHEVIGTNRHLTEENRAYLEAKAALGGHNFSQ